MNEHGFSHRAIVNGRRVQICTCGTGFSGSTQQARDRALAKHLREHGRTDLAELLEERAA